MSNPNSNSGPPSRHRADDDLQDLASGAFAPVVPPLDMTNADDIPDVDLTASEEIIDENEPLEVHYDSDDDDDVSVGSATDGAAELSKRTANLMDSFRDYVSDMGDNGEGGGGGNGGGEGGEGGGGGKGQAVGEMNKDRILFTNKEMSDSPLLMKKDLDWYGNGGLRDFTNPDDEAAGGRGGGDGFEVYVDEEYGTPRSSSTRNIVRYKYAWLRSKRVKKAFGMILLAIVLIAIISGVSKANKERSLPDWNKELADMEKEEKHKHETTPSEPLQKYPEVPFDHSQPHNDQQQPHKIGDGHQTSHAGTNTKPPSNNGGAKEILTNVLTTKITPPPTPNPTRTYQENEGIAKSYALITQKYAPMWYSRIPDLTHGTTTTTSTTGHALWDGTTYEQALVFCAEQSSMMIPCPYEAICPNGPDYPPFGGGYKDEPDPEATLLGINSGGMAGGGDGIIQQWAPIIDDENNWVQVSSGFRQAGSGDGCAKYSDLYNGADTGPPWGEEGGNEEQTRHLLCCRSGALEEGEDVEDAVVEATPSEATPTDNTPPAASAVSDKTNLTADKTNPNNESPQPAVSDKTNPDQFNQPDESQPFIDPQVILNEILNQPIQDESVIATEYSQAESRQPQWYDRSSGWMGQTYDAALEFCATIHTREGGDDHADQGEHEHELCPYSVYCPTGPHHIPYGGMAEEPSGISWSPLSDSYNDWVQVGKNGMCLTYMNLNLLPPVWGLSGEENEEITRHILCCTKPSSPVVPAVPPPAAEVPATEDVAKIEEELINEDLISQEYIEAEKFEPVWYDRKSGWGGSTYQEAVDFCEIERGAMHQLCPYEVYCPLGKNNLPYGGGFSPTRSDVDLLWAPIRDANNNWVQIGSGDSNEDNNLCLTVDGISVDGGVDLMDVTEYIMCCRRQQTAMGGDDAGGDVGGGEAVVTTTTTVKATANPTPISTVLPLVFNRDDGWGGQTYLEAITYCASIADKENGWVNYQICPYEVLCPEGPGKVPIVGTVPGVDGDPAWVPLADEGNDWVDLSPENSCVRYRAEHSGLPEWGRTGEDNEELTRNILCCKGSIYGGAQESYVYEAAAEMYHPIWHDRDSGWTGQTYVEAEEFCSKNNKRFGICPYDAICPFSDRDEPLGGVKEGPRGTWVPMAGVSNGWVSVGPENTCQIYDIVHGEQALWGLTGEGNEDITRHVACCETGDGEAFPDVEEAPVTPKPTPLPTLKPTIAPTKQPTPLPTKEPTPNPTLQPTPLPTNQPTSFPTPLPTLRPTPKPTALDVYSGDAMGFEPIWYDRTSGWSGQTYNEAVNFCRSLTNIRGETMMICPYEAYCPLGEGTIPYGGVKATEPNGSWAPIINSDNHWVQLGTENMCVPYTAIYPDPPAWGITGQNNEDRTRHVMCCNRFNRLNQPPTPPPVTAAPVSAAKPSADQAIDRAHEIEQITNQISTIFEPVGFDRYQTWSGSTYTEVAEFCSDKGHRGPCSFEALCPNGMAQQPLGPDSGRGFGLEEIWAPIIDEVDAWVELRNDGWCARHTDLPRSEDVMRYALCCVQPGDHSGVQQKPAPAPVPTPVAAPSSAGTPGQITPEQMNEVYEASAEKFHVASYDRGNGWLGQTYGEALEFCAKQDSKIPCPYEAICPLGSEGEPVGGAVTAPNGAWAPIMDTANDWVQIGHKDTCMTYNSMKPHPPKWGLTGEENEAITRHIKCCDEVVGGGAHEEDKMVEIPQLSRTEEVILDTMHPVWYERHHGYHGTTHEEAELFCRTVGMMHLCPVEAYCPNGPRNNKSLFLQQDAFSGEQWAPVSNYNNEDAGVGNNWIMVGTKDGDPLSTCSQYEMLYDGKSPPWTADGSRTELKQQILCCMQQEAMKHEQDISHGMNPIWLDSSHGWNGGSYEDAEVLCQGLGRKKLCPYAVYCPHGPGRNPMGGHSEDFNLQGEQWAPVYGTGNQWVLIGRKYENSATTCYTHNQLEGESPSWGVSSDNSRAKRHVQCCTF